jgi:hypothetical protein
LFPTLYTENEGVERLFHTNQLLIASDFFEARAATIGAPPEAYLESLLSGWCLSKKARRALAVGRMG